MASIQEKYEELVSTITSRHERIFKHVGVPNPAGGWYMEPRLDPDEDYQIPTLRVFFISPKNPHQRLADLAENGWVEFRPESAPVGVRTVTAQESEPAPRSTTKRRR